MTKREFKYKIKRQHIRHIKNIISQLRNCGGKPIVLPPMEEIQSFNFYKLPINFVTP